ncbi:MAG: hypothetical protein GX369_01475 [Euryarchaeota archaeon]|nr:hypothetical protein [Euryarchaeota archaeon]
MRSVPHILASIGIAIMLLIVVIAPIVTIGSADPISREIEQPTETGALPLAVPIFLAILNFAAATYIVYDHLTKDDELVHGVDETGRQLEADIVIEMLDINGQLLVHNLNGFVDIWRFTNSYWMRQAEIAAAEQWGVSNQYSAQTLIERARLYINLAQLVRNINEGPDATFSQLNDRVAIWQTVDGYESMKFKLQHDSSSTSYANGLDLNVRPTTIATTDVNKVYLTGDPLWSMGAGTAYAVDGTEIILSQGYNAMSGTTPGVYKLSPGTYAGGMLPAILADACVLKAGIVISSPDGISIAIRGGDGIKLNGNGYQSFKLVIDTGSKTSDPVDLMPLLRHYDGMIRGIEQSLSKSASAANAAWRVYSAAGEANILLSPSSLVSQLEGIDISDEQMAVLTTLYLRQVHDYYQRVQGDLDATGWSLSPDSIDLYMRGDVYDTSGTLLYESVIMTPYIWLEDWTITKDLVTARQSGLLAVWGETEDLNTWSGADSGQGAQIIALELGYQLDVKQIVKSGQAVSSVSLTIMEIQEWEPIVMPKPHQPPKIYNIDYLIATIGILLGALIALIGVATKRFELLIVGSIVAILIIVRPELIRELI